MTPLNPPGRVVRTTTALITASVATIAPLLAAPTAGAHAGHARPSTYTLHGDPGGSTFEGIGYDARTGRFYVSEVTGGEIHRGVVGRSDTRQWLTGDGTDGRFTARGITVDRLGRIFISGGPNSADHPGAPDFWIYSARGRLIAALRTGLEGMYINDVTLGPDGSAYFTNSNSPQIFRVAHTRAGWQVSLWKDAAPTVVQGTGLAFNGIVTTPDGRALIAVQSNAGKLWRFDLRTRAVSEIGVGGTVLTSGDGLVLRGHELTVVRNFPRRLVTLRLDRNWRSGALVADRATAPDRVFTTAKIAKGRLLAVDSKFDEQPAPMPPYQVVALRLP